MTQASPPTDAPIACQRHRFTLPADLHYLNGAYMSPLSSAVQAAGSRGIQAKAVPTRISPPDFFTESDAARARFARLVNAPAERVALIPAVSYGMATVARNLEIAAGQTIVVLDAQFPSNIYSWRRLAAATGAARRYLERASPRGHRHRYRAGGRAAHALDRRHSIRLDRDR